MLPLAIWEHQETFPFQDIWEMGTMLAAKTLAMPKITFTPHAYPEKWVKQQYLPDKLVGKQYFSPNETGKYERALGANKERIDKLSSKSFEGR